MVTDFPCVLLQRTTAKEQIRRLIAAELPPAFIEKHGAVVIENHLNMIKPLNGAPRVSPAVLAVLLNCEVVDQVFRCINGSVAVSAYELEALPLPSPEAMEEIERLMQRGATRGALEQASTALILQWGRMMPLPPLLPVPAIHQRLQIIYPEGTTNRNYVTREMAAKTVFVMLYIGAVEGTGRWLRPDQVTRMTDAQAALASDGEREDWFQQSMWPAAGNIEGRWYAANTREPIRDETLRGGLIQTGAVSERKGLPTTSPRPRYALSRSFAALFHPDLEEDMLDEAITAWREANLTSGALARVALVRRATVAGGERVLVTFPNTRHPGQTRSSWAEFRNNKIRGGGPSRRDCSSSLALFGSVRVATRL